MPIQGISDYRFTSLCNKIGVIKNKRKVNAMSTKKHHIETLAVHAGQATYSDPTTCARAVPVYRTTAYNFHNSNHGADLFGLRKLGNIYARLMNPTNDLLAKRIARHSENALAVAKWLAAHPKVAWVRYPALSQPELAEKYLPNGAGGMVVFGVKGGAYTARRFVDAANGDIFSILANVGDAKSLIIHPASTTHSQLSDEDLLKGGVAPELIRLSIGIEHIDDIIAALSEAFDSIAT